MSDGLRVKYNVTKISDGSLVNDCFVLRPDRDQAAVEALKAYANATNNDDLAYDILNWPDRIENVKREGDGR